MSTSIERIRAEIAAHGAISFARYMELALYCPVCGFYEKEADTVGRQGDFYTSVSVGSLFGQLLALQFADWLEHGRTPVAGSGKSNKATGARRIVEAGAHDGQLARDILRWLRLRRPALFEEIEYCIVELSALRRSRQQTTLGEFGAGVRWFDGLSGLAAARVDGLIFSNELLDAMPVHRFGWDARERRWFEWGVAFSGGRFGWTRLPGFAVPPPPLRGGAGDLTPSETAGAAPTLPAELLEVLPDGFTTETGRVAAGWWREAALTLACGKLLTLDYGLNAEEFFAPQRMHGTLRAYHRHQVSDGVLDDAGERDITAHVNFTAIQTAGESVGLKTETFASQAQFLTGIAQRAWRDGSDFGAWSKEHTRQFQTLTHPDHLGRAFRVLVQSR